MYLQFYFEMFEQSTYRWLIDWQAVRTSTKHYFYHQYIFIYLFFLEDGDTLWFLKVQRGCLLLSLLLKTKTCSDYPVSREVPYTGNTGIMSNLLKMFLKLPRDVHVQMRMNAAVIETGCCWFWFELSQRFNSGCKSVHLVWATACRRWISKYCNICILLHSIHTVIICSDLVLIPQLHYLKRHVLKTV